MMFLAMVRSIGICLGADEAYKAPGRKTPTPNLAARLFQLPKGVELDEQQALRVAVLLRDYEPKLAAFQTRILSLLADEQRATRAAAFAESRGQPEEGRAIRDNSIAELGLSKEQERQLQQIRIEKSELKRAALQAFFALLTDEQRAIINHSQPQRKRRTTMLTREHTILVEIPNRPAGAG